MKNSQKVKSHHKNYHIVAPGSYVDSTLFSGFEDVNCNNNSRSKEAESNQLVRIRPFHINKSPGVSHQRDLVNTERGHGPLILTQFDVKRLEEEKKEMCNKEDIEIIKSCLEERQKEIDAIEECKQTWRQRQEERDCREGATDVECEEQHKMNLLKENYCLEKLQREEEIKMMKTLLNRAGSVEAWNQQTKEKKDAMDAWKKEDRRMDEEMERYRQSALSREEDIRASRRADLMRGLVQQINQKKLHKLEEEEVKYMEGVRQRECWARANEEELRRMREAGGCTKTFKGQLDVCLMDKKFHRLKEDELERRMLARVEEVRQEMERKNQLQKNDKQERIRSQQRTADLLRCKQEEAQSNATEAEERRLKRAMQQLERDKRTRELIEASMRNEAGLRSKMAWQRQLQLKREAEAVQAAKDRMFYESDLRKLIREKEQDEGVEGERWKRQQYGTLLRQQMCEVEAAKKKEICAKFQDRMCRQQEERDRKRLILQFADKSLSQHKCAISAPRLLKISQKVKHMADNPL